MRTRLLPLLFLLALPATAHTVSRQEARPVSGAEAKDEPLTVTESRVLRAGPEVGRAVYSRDAVFVVVAESRPVWDRDVAPGLARALSGAPRDVGAFVALLPPHIGRAGPDIEGGLVEFELPGGRGKGFVAVQLPRLLRRGPGDPQLLNSRKPNQGLFLSGAAVRKADDAALSALYLPGRPRPMTRGLPPAVQPRELPGKGRGALSIFRGRGETGDEARDLMKEIDRFLDAKKVPAGVLRTFPKEGDLARELRSFRVAAEALAADEGWYRALSRDPASWTFEERRLSHPTRRVAFTAPVSVIVDGEQHELVVGGVALYTPLLLSPEQASLLSGVPPREFFAAVHAGELPFLRDQEELWFTRADLQRWRAGEARRGEGKERTHGQAVRRVEGWGERLGSARVGRAARGALPFRYVAIPEADRESLVDTTRAARGRVFEDDLVAWVRHADERAQLDGPGASFSLREAEGAAAFAARFELGAPPARSAPSEPEEPPFSVGGDAVAVAEDAGETEEEDAGPEEAPGEFDLDGPPPGSTAGPALEILDLYPVQPTCRPGEPFELVVEFLLDGLEEDEQAELSLEWDAVQGGRSMTRDAEPVARGPGEAELEFSATCPGQDGVVELEVLLDWPARGIEAKATTRVTAKAPFGRSWSKLAMPSPKSCLSSSASLSDEDDFAMAGAQGLSADQITAAVRGFQQQTLRCADRPRPVSGTVVLEFVVGCDGRVSSAAVSRDETFDAEFASCVADVMRYTPFPAHDMPDGASFEIPLMYE